MKGSANPIKHWTSKTNPPPRPASPPRPELSIEELVENKQYDEAINRLKAEDENNTFANLIEESKRLLVLAMIAAKNMPQQHIYDKIYRPHEINRHPEYEYVSAPNERPRNPIYNVPTFT